MLTFKNIWKRYGTEHVLNKVSFSVGAGQKVALVGQNGAGKSTLLKIIAGMETPERGEILKPKRALIGYLPQEAQAESKETLGDYLRRTVGLTNLEKEMKILEPSLAEPKNLEQYELLRQEYARLGGDNFTRQAKSVLDGLRLTHIKPDRFVSELSGGEKRKVALAGVLLRGADILLLDEPTNNLDLRSLMWLENYLKSSSAICIIASHDRRFLDNVVKKVIEIDWHKRDVAMYAGGWSVFAEMKAHQTRKHQEEYRAQEMERERLIISSDQKMDWVERINTRKAPDHDKFSEHFKKERAERKFTAAAKVLDERRKRLHKIEKPLTRSPLIIVFTESADEKKDNSIVLKNVCFGYPNSFQGGLASPKTFAGGPVNLNISFGRRVAILGDNGAGKSTLLKTITGELVPLSGERICGEKLIFGYLMQEHENISHAITPAELFQKHLKIYDREMIAEHLAHFQFSPYILDDKIMSLSPGERVRLALALLSARNVNALVLDEPTNHLDLEAIEALEEALETYTGTILLVTHDRRFLERIRLTASFVLDGGKLSVVKNYEAYAAAITRQLNNGN
jgi:ATPase subunit of ABC transporter with duplicated ATPase domains